MIFFLIIIIYIYSQYTSPYEDNCQEVQNGCQSKSDVVFLLDNSGSITDPQYCEPDCSICPSENCNNCVDDYNPECWWDEVMNFTASIICNLHFGEDNFGVGMVKFDSSSTILWNLTSNKNEAFNNLNNMDQYGDSGGSTYLDLGYENALKVFQDSSRSDSNKYLIVLCDGIPNGGNENQRLQDIKDAYPEIIIISIAVGSNVNTTYMRDIATNDNYYIRAETFDDLSNIILYLTELTCGIITSINPDSACYGDDVIINVEGVNFNDVSVSCKLNNTIYTATYFSSELILCYIDWNDELYTYGVNYPLSISFNDSEWENDKDFTYLYQFDEECINCPVCDPPCVNGICNSQLECECIDGWEGDQCDTPMNATLVCYKSYIFHDFSNCYNDRRVVEGNDVICPNEGYTGNCSYFDGYKSGYNEYYGYYVEKGEEIDNCELYAQTVEWKYHFDNSWHIGIYNIDIKRQSNKKYLKLYVDGDTHVCPNEFSVDGDEKLYFHFVTRLCFHCTPIKIEIFINGEKYCEHSSLKVSKFRFIIEEESGSNDNIHMIVVWNKYLTNENIRDLYLIGDNRTKDDEICLLEGCPYCDGVDVYPEIPMCGNYSSLEEDVCSSNGKCIANETCLCAECFYGEYCLLFNETCNLIPYCNTTEDCPYCNETKGCDTCPPVCEPICINGNCTYEGCVCWDGWNGTQCDDSICKPKCNNGLCITPDTCVCNYGYFGLLCNDTCTDIPTCFNISALDPLVCSSNGKCINHEECLCAECFYSEDCSLFNETCNLIPYCNTTEDCPYCNETKGCDPCPDCPSVCEPICINGNCTSEGCVCLDGWNGTQCDDSVCSPSCINGECIAPNVCVCDYGYYGDICNLTYDEFPFCFNLSSIDPNVCSSNGKCLEDDYCLCAECFYSEDCSEFNTTCTLIPYCNTTKDCPYCPIEPPCVPECQNGGDCVWGMCNCTDEWEGSTCKIPVCEPECYHGNCTRYFNFIETNICICFPGWEGDQCKDPICDPECNHGECVAPNKCVCESGWFGSICNEDCEYIPKCFNISANHEDVCSSNGKCLEDDYCLCAECFYGEDCFEFNTTCNLIPYCNTTEDCPQPEICTFVEINATKSIIQYNLKQLDCENDDTGDIYDLTCSEGVECTDKGIKSNSICINDNICDKLENYGPYGFIMQFKVNITTLNEGIYIDIVNLVIQSFGNVGKQIFNIRDECSDSLSFHQYGQEIQYMEYEIHFNETETIIYVNNEHLTTFDKGYPLNCSCNGTFISLRGDDNSYLSDLKIDVLANESTSNFACFGIGCLNNLSCSGHGVCVSQDVCQCDSLWGGLNCNEYLCPNQTICEDVPKCFNISANHEDVCSSNGKCLENDYCFCAECFYGNNCSEFNTTCNLIPYCNETKGCPDEPPCVPECQNGGDCVWGICNCTDEWEGPTCEIPVCDPKCHHGTCNETHQCECLVGWESEQCNDSICNPECDHGECHAPDVCECEIGWEGDICDNPICDPKCHHGNCTEEHTCECFLGWEGDLCEDPICNPDCINGECIAPNKCVCESGWFGSICNEDCEYIPKCFNISSNHEDVCSSNGKCLEDDYCLCAECFYGNNCSEFNTSCVLIPYCNTTEDCPTEPPCVPECQNGGDCVWGICNCTNEWEGPTCEIPICEPECHHGTCNETHQCECYLGWDGELCDNPICDPECDHGECHAPDVCECEIEWQGDLCDNPICDPKCHHGNCTQNHTCKCYQGWEGEYCEDPICNPECNHGECHAPDVCECDPLWQGDLCDNPICDPNCHHGECNETNQCECYPGWFGLKCENATCDPECYKGYCIAPNTCDCFEGWRHELCDDPICDPKCHHGNCTEEHTCECYTGWESEQCEDSICDPECDHGECHAPDVCECESNWEGDLCDKSICDPECHHGICNETHQCECYLGWYGEQCENPICDPECVNGTCIKPNICLCNDGWTGDLCDEPYCDDNCHHGNCTDEHTCDCYPGWEGEKCDDPICDPECDHGECVAPDACECELGWQGDICDDPICEPHCKHGNCTSPDYCECESGWEGDLCDDPICDPECDHGECHAPDVCECESGWEGDLCDKPICDPECHHGICNETHQCECFVGWEGEQCDDPICDPECDHGECHAPDVCECELGWEGDLCDKPICDPKCHHGNCTDEHTCECYPGWEGELCEDPICNPECDHGECHAPDVCECDPLWQGDLCDESICTPMCHHGTCNETNQCECYLGWKGELCENPICNPNCVHGYCISPNECKCYDGFWGEICNEGVPMCGNYSANDTRVCNERGGCFEDGCHCAEGYYGDYCEFFNTTLMCESDIKCIPECINGICVYHNVCKCFDYYWGDACENGHIETIHENIINSNYNNNLLILIASILGGWILLLLCCCCCFSIPILLYKKKEEEEEEDEEEEILLEGYKKELYTNDDLVI